MSNEWNFGEMEGNPEDLDNFRNPRRLPNATGANTPDPLSGTVDDVLARQQHRVELQSKSKELSGVIKDASKSYKDKQDAITALLVEIIPVLITEITAVTPNPDISLAISRTTSLLKELSSQFERTEKHRLDMTINPASPRFQEAFAMFVSDVFDSVADAQIPDNYKAAFTNAFSDRLRGFEARVENLNTMSQLTRAKLPISPTAQDVVNKSKAPLDPAKMN